MSVKKRNIVGVIAGNGELPREVAEAILANGKEVFVLAIDGHADVKMLKNISHQVVALGKMQKAVDLLRQHHIGDIIFVGGINRVSLSDLKLDRAGMALLFKAGMKKISGGDDNLLTLVLKFFEEHKFVIKSVQELAPQLLFLEQYLGKIRPSSSELKDIEKGQKVLSLLGASDVGQAIIVEDDHVLGIEAAEGTDKLIERCGSLKKEVKKSGILVKIVKSKQDPRIDLPTIGIKTIELLHNHRFKGMAIRKSSTIILNRREVEEAVNRYKLFIVGI